MTRWLAFCGGLFALIATTACGYHVAGKANVLPEDIHSIAVPAFANTSLQYHIADRITAAVTHELVQRTRYRITGDPETADAVLTGSLVNVISYPTTFDPVTNRASGIQMVVQIQAKLTDRRTGKVLYNRPNFEVRERYEIAVDPKTYFDESGGAADRLSRDIAQSLVSGILERF